MSSKCEELHKIFNNLPRFKFPFDYKKISLNGIYVLFEKGEHAHGFDRIVRIGTHTGPNLLRSRLKQHFIIPNKDGSIFRKNIGRTILNIRKDPYLKIWDLAMTTKESLEKYGHLINKEYQKQIEKEVSDYIQQNFTFCFFEVTENDKRKLLESRLISTISQCMECHPSTNWFGLNSPIEKIRQSGLWLVNELYKEPVNDDNINLIINLVNSQKNIFFESIKKEKFLYMENKPFNSGNKIWVNVNKPTKKCTIHTNLSCPYVLAIRETHRKGIENLKIDGGWKSFLGYVQAKDYCEEWEGKKDYITTTCC